MKQKLLHIILFVLAALTMAACGNTDTDIANMSDEEILKVLDIKIHQDPDNAKLYYDRAKVLMRMSQSEADSKQSQVRVSRAINDLMKATRLDDDEFDYYILLGDAYFANGDIEHSYSTFEKALELDPKSTEATLKLGEIAFYGRDYDRAMDHLSKVTAADKDNRSALMMKSFIYMETGDTTNATVLLRKVCDLYPDFPQAFETLGSLYADKLNPMAVEYLNTAIRLDPQNTNPLYCLAMYYQNKNNADQAEELYKRILDINANNQDAWHNRGYIECFYNGNYDLAIEYFTKAIQINNRFLEAHANRGCAYELKGDRANAEICFRTALHIDPDFQPAVDGLSRLGKR